MSSDDHSHLPSSTKRQRTTSLLTMHRPITNVPALLLEQQLESLQAELDHERSLRNLDQRRAQQQKELLEQQVEFAVKEATNAKQLINDFRTESQNALQKMKDARDMAYEEVRKLQVELIDAREESENGDDADHTWKSEYNSVKQKLQFQEEYEQKLLEQIKDLENEVRKLSEELLRTKPPDLQQMNPSPSQDAPSDLLRELQRVRIELAETERSHRQLQRSLQAAEQRNKTLVDEREVAQRGAERLPKVLAELDNLRKDHEDSLATQIAWKTFGEELFEKLKGTGIFSMPIKTNNHLLPPEVSTVLRILESVQQKIEKTTQENNKLCEKVRTLESAMKSTETQSSQNLSKQLEWSKERSKLEQKLVTSEQETALLKKKNSVYQGEIESLRDLIRTFDDLPLATHGSAASDNAKDASALKILQLSLDTKTQEIAVLEKERQELKVQLESTKLVNIDSKEELDRVKAKFVKLRDTLQEERAKVEQAEARAIEAEALAGRGSFDPNRTRVLHFKETPFVQSLKEEVQVLRRQLELKSASSSKVAPDPDKLNQRLKQNFKEQIALFREGVYLMTGFKVDMLPGTDRPTFRVRSMFAEREEDHLMLKWPKGGETIKSLDILGTELAKLLAASPSYEYMTKFHSLPAFLASVQLSLFEKQTMMM
ncbi:mitotic spindle assembly checkpoint protein MAD1 [Fistulifera solaris]|uniref:Mitotic spindle assembly checkpoint protein MAD1 n=1 Tax=Fistulifera solaris TaxID=1519565 RepID=A0A1Z5K4G0_FISSO|nr:mitotic spindle assembly checkpoint protein MAD1 [Fistulifera solaris]|eukprot:GAX21140.1 mitotic spindle assembly checkpoint protein MAD1 [Fistulifera solaris]